MTITYEFPARYIPSYRDDWDEYNTEEYDYYPTEEDYIEYFKDYGKETFVELAVEAWNSLPEESKKFYLDPKHSYADDPSMVSGDTFNWERVYDDEDLLGLVAEDIVSRGPRMESIMKDWCKEKAEKEYYSNDY